MNEASYYEQNLNSAIPRNCQTRERGRVSHFIKYETHHGFHTSPGRGQPLHPSKEKDAAFALLELLPCNSRAKRKPFRVILERSEESRSYLARYFTGEAASSQSDEAVRVPRLTIMRESPAPALALFLLRLRVIPTGVRGVEGPRCPPLRLALSGRGRRSSSSVG